MAFRKKTKKVEEAAPEITDVEITDVDTTKEVSEAKPKTIKKGSKVIANGRLFGSANLECPMGSIRNQETKIVGIYEKSYEIKEGYIAKENVK